MAFWNPEEVELLQKLWGQKITTEGISVIMKRSRNAIIGASHRYGLPPKTPGRTRKPRRRPAPPSLKAAAKKPPVWTVAGNTAKQRVAPTAVIDQPPIQGGVPIMQLTSEHCRAIVGKEEDFRGLATYCGQPVVNSGSYCHYHAGIFYVRAK